MLSKLQSNLVLTQNSHTGIRSASHALFYVKVIDQLDKKRKVFQAILDKGTALTQKPKSPEFLGREVKRAGDLWKETNSQALDRLNRLKGLFSI